MSEGGPAIEPRRGRVIDVAGSRDAIATLLAALRAPGVSVIVVDPRAKCAAGEEDLVPWLSSRTSLPVSVATHGEALDVDHVYVIPSGRAARIEAGVLWLDEPALGIAVAEERERRRIAAGLHDQVGQLLACAQMRLSAARGGTHAELLSAVDHAIGALTQSAREIRTLVFELSPPVLFDFGLYAALEWLAEQLEVRHGLRVELDVDPRACPAPRHDLATVLFRTIRELLLNVVKHAGVKRARVSLAIEGAYGDAIVAEIADEGAGFDPTSQIGQNGHFGLFSVREQTARLGGALSLESAEGRGTRARVLVPRGRR